MSAVSSAWVTTQGAQLRHLEDQNAIMMFIAFRRLDTCRLQSFPVLANPQKCRIKLEFLLSGP